MTSQYRPEIIAAAAAQNLDPLLVEAVVWQESSDKRFAFRYEPAFWERYLYGRAHAPGIEFGPLAACSYGLMQVLYTVAREDGFSGAPEELFDVIPALQVGCVHLRKMLDWAQGDDAKALAAYNAGTGNWQAGQDYAASVLAWKAKLT